MLRFLFGRARSSKADPEAAVRPDELDAEAMKVIVGLGNPGREYERTRHNVGWWVVDHLADVWRFEPWKRDGEARVTTGSVGRARVRLVKPQTYMNLSGSVLRSYLRRPAWSAASDLMIVVDEVALPLGRYRFRARGSAGGHNGLKSIEAAVGSQDYARLRIGIAPDDPRRRGDLSDFVLDNFAKQESDVVRALMPTLTQALELWTSHGITPVLNRFTGTTENGSEE
ncbi:MAG TPA: aminoacyl-tRNA hydrolase [Gemmatimonadaceae bacterium]|nr:aminoacyl-tRNA hydrolase [Gemmatimonadaceae bacterium]